MKKVLLFIAGIIFCYFISVLVLFIFNVSFENIWLSAVFVTISAVLLMLLWHFGNKRKMKKIKPK